MSVVQQPSATGEYIIFRQRRGVELALTLAACTFGLVGWVVSYLNLRGSLPPELIPGTIIWFALALGAHAIVRWRIPYADPVILPVVFLLNGLGLAMIARLDLAKNAHAATNQIIWTGLGIALFAAVVFWLRDHRRLQRFPYLLFLGGLLMLILPLVPLVGRELNGARIWIGVGPFSFQPAEVAKILLALAFAAYFYEKRDLLALAGRRFIGLEFPRARDLGPIAVMWLLSLAIMVFQNDLGTALLFFGLFTFMIYVATQRPAWPILAGIAFVIAGLLAYNFTNHVPRRVNSWLNPFSDYDGNYQIIQAQFGFAWGGLFGRGWGQGSPWLTPMNESDFIAASLAEEIGIVGLMAIVLMYGFIVARGMKTALTCPDGFGKLLAGGLAFTFAVQVFSITGGITRLLPLTGLTTPFMSQGGSSLIANWMIIGILMVISHRARMPQRATATPQELLTPAQSTAVIAK